jgi:hypothetical protein
MHSLFLKDAYRNHSEHARDEHYDLPKAQSILNHVRDFMRALAKGGLSEWRPEVALEARAQVTTKLASCCDENGELF